jgi:uncharacterized protein YifN (PemK superfamily)
MGLTYHPKVGQILLCDFSGFRPPEMVKKRPVIVLAPPHTGGSELSTVVPLSTVTPEPVQPYHYLLPRQCLPKQKFFMGKNTWLKGDMVYTVGFHRLEAIQVGRDPQTGKRVYFSNKLGREHMKNIYTCVLHGLHMSWIVNKLD